MDDNSTARNYERKCKKIGISHFAVCLETLANILLLCNCHFIIFYGSIHKVVSEVIEMARNRLRII